MVRRLADDGRAPHERRKEDDMSTEARPRAGFGTKKTQIPGVVTRATSMFNNMTLNAAMFQSPTITLVAFLALLTALTVAQGNLTTSKAKGLASLRNTK